MFESWTLKKDFDMSWNTTTIILNTHLWKCSQNGVIIIIYLQVKLVKTAAKAVSNLQTIEPNLTQNEYLTLVNHIKKELVAIIF